MKSVLTLATLAAAPLASAQLAPPPFLLGGEYQAPADFDNGGSFSRSVARARISAPIWLEEDLIVGLSVGYQYESYQFSGLAVDPWSDLHRVRLGLVAKGDLANDWSWILLPFASADAETGADWGEALTFGGIGGAWYNFNDRLSLGLGLGVSTQLEDDTNIFPIVILDWKLTDTLTLTTVPPEGFRLGPGVSLRWDAREDLSLSLIYQYQRDRHRLDENSRAAANGLGELRQSRLAVAATYRYGDNLSLTAHAGMAVGGGLELFDEDGASLSDTDFDPTFAIGMEGSLRF